MRHGHMGGIDDWHSHPLSRRSSSHDRHGGFSIGRRRKKGWDDPSDGSGEFLAGLMGAAALVGIGYLLFQAAVAGVRVAKPLWLLAWSSLIHPLRDGSWTVLAVFVSTAAAVFLLLLLFGRFRRAGWAIKLAVFMVAWPLGQFLLYAVGGAVTAVDVFDPRTAPHLGWLASFLERMPAAAESPDATVPLFTTLGSFAVFVVVPALYAALCALRWTLALILRFVGWVFDRLLEASVVVYLAIRRSGFMTLTAVAMASIVALAALTVPTPTAQPPFGLWPHTPFLLGAVFGTRAATIGAAVGLVAARPGLALSAEVPPDLPAVLVSVMPWWAAFVLTAVLAGLRRHAWILGDGARPRWFLVVLCLWIVTALLASAGAPLAADPGAALGTAIAASVGSLSPDFVGMFIASVLLTLGCTLVVDALRQAVHTRLQTA